MQLWKENWGETRERFINWWQHKGVLIGNWRDFPAEVMHDASAEYPPKSATVEEWYSDVEHRAQSEYARLARMSFFGDSMPVATSMIGPGSLGLAMGCEPGFSPETVWFKPAFKDVEDVNDLPPLRFNPDAYWWQVHERQFRAHKEKSQGHYFVGIPDLVENVDIVAALRDPQTLMVDMLENPEWILRSVEEVNQAYFEGYTRLYEIAKDAEGGIVYDAFRLWGPGKTAKVQCDAAAMFSPEMFRDLVVPGLTRQCDWLDFSMFHVDGPECICHVEHLLKIPSLDVIQWTPGAGKEPYWHERWFPLYKKVIDGGKSLWIEGTSDLAKMEKVFQVTGGNGVYICGGFDSPRDYDALRLLADKYE